MDMPIIAALATPPGQSGIAVVRVSGPGAAALVDRVFCFGSLTDMERRTVSGYAPDDSAKRSLEAMEGYRCALGYLRDPASAALLDQCIATRFRAPHSYTGEDVVELSFHGSAAARRQILDCLYDCGAKPAAAGEFTRRAFLNGKLDLAQAEAVMDLISSEAALSSELALEQLQGRLSRQFLLFRERLYALLAGLEIGIDYPEHEDFDLRRDELPRALAELRAALRELLSGYRQSRTLRSGLQVALVGSPNVGKSSLLNALSGQDRAIVTDIAGTTRDTLDSVVDIGGLPVCLTDTAGLRDSDDPVEKIGVSRARQAMAKADYILWTLAPEWFTDFSAQDCAARLDEILKDFPEAVPFTLLLNKQDLPGAEELARHLRDEVFPLLQRPAFLAALEAENSSGRPALLLVSAQTGVGLEALQAAIFQVYHEMGAGQSEHLRLGSERHLSIVRRALALLEKIEGDLAFLPNDILSQSLQAVAEILAEISGENVSEQLIDEIFSRFCVGK